MRTQTPIQPTPNPLLPVDLEFKEFGLEYFENWTRLKLG